jgi:hypothetical protein
VDRNIKLLAAQRAFYSKAKKIFGLQLFLSGPVIVVLGVISLLDSKFISVINFYTVVLSLVEVVVISRSISRYKKMGAAIQEDFDCGILNLSWNEVLSASKVSLEKVNEWSEKIKDNNRGDLLSWYGDFPDIFSYPAARIVIQKYNTNWDNDLRNSFLRDVVFVSGGFAIVILLIFSVENFSFSDFYKVLLPVLPITILLVSFYTENKSSIENLDAVRNKLNEAWDDLIHSRKSGDELMLVARNIQDAIYLHRVDSPLIFDWYYKRKSRTQQGNADFSVEQLKNEYILSQK